MYVTSKTQMFGALHKFCLLLSVHVCINNLDIIWQWRFFLIFAYRWHTYQSNAQMLANIVRHDYLPLNNPDVLSQCSKCFKRLITNVQISFALSNNTMQQPHRSKIWMKNKSFFKHTCQKSDSAAFRNVFANES